MSIMVIGHLLPPTTATRLTATKTTATRTTATRLSATKDNCYHGQLLPRTVATKDNCYYANCYQAKYALVKIVKLG